MSFDSLGPFLPQEPPIPAVPRGDALARATQERRRRQGRRESDPEHRDEDEATDTGSDDDAVTVDGLPLVQDDEDDHAAEANDGFASSPGWVDTPGYRGPDRRRTPRDDDHPHIDLSA